MPDVKLIIAELVSLYFGGGDSATLLITLLPGFLPRSVHIARFIDILACILNLR